MQVSSPTQRPAPSDASAAGAPAGADRPTAATALAGPHDPLTKPAPQPPGGTSMPPRPAHSRETLTQLARTRQESGPAVALKSVAVADWDDCLRHEKSMNYELMHNALVLAAREYGDAHPELAQAVARLRGAGPGGAAAGADAPLLARSQEEFAKYLLPRPEIEEGLVLEDFVRKALPGLPPEKAEAVNHILWAHFARQYKAITQPPREHVRPQAMPPGLPYPDVELKLTPGAQEFLTKSRQDETPVILVSNRSHVDVENEVGRLGMQPYFAAVSGAWLMTRATGPKPMTGETKQALQALLNRGDDAALLDALIQGVPHAQVPGQPASGQPAAPPSLAEVRERMTDALQRDDGPALLAVLAQAAPLAHAELEQRLKQALRSGDSAGLATVRAQLSAYAHPDTTTVEWVDRKPSSRRLQEKLAQLGVPPGTPITSYGDRVTDVQQLSGLRSSDPPDLPRPLEGVIVNPQHPDVGRSISVDGIPTRVRNSFADLP